MNATISRPYNELSDQDSLLGRRANSPHKTDKVTLRDLDGSARRFTPIQDRQAIGQNHQGLKEILFYTANPMVRLNVQRGEYMPVYLASRGNIPGVTTK